MSDDFDDRRLAHLVDLGLLADRNGWAVQGVFPTEPGGVGFAYTVGLTVRGLPELVVSGPWDDDAGTLLNIAAMRHEKLAFQAGQTLEGIVPVGLRVIEAPMAEVNMARSLYGPDRVSALQLVWPDDHGRWPGQNGFVFGQQLFGPAWW